MPFHKDEFLNGLKKDVHISVIKRKLRFYVPSILTSANIKDSFAFFRPLRVFVVRKCVNLPYVCIFVNLKNNVFDM